MDIDKLLGPLEWIVAWLMVSFHQLFTFVGLPKDSGLTWSLSIVGLVIVIRIVLIPLFVKQIHATRRMAIVQPEIQKIQKKYKGKTDAESRQAMTQETMALYKRTGTNPMASCLPILLQSPVFFALFRVLQNLPKIAGGTHDPIGVMSQNLAHSAEQSTVFGAPLSSFFYGAAASPNPQNTRIVTVVLILLMSISTFTSQRQLMMKNMPASALDNQYGKMQKMMIYLAPLGFAVSGPSLPIGVLIYWTTTNVWSMGQQFYTIRKMPAPGSLAEKALEARRLKSGKEHKKFTVPGLSQGAEDAQTSPTTETQPKSGQRQQPKRKNRARATGQGDGSPGVKPLGSKPPGSKAPGVKPPGVKPHGSKPGVKPPAAAEGDS